MITSGAFGESNSRDAHNVSYIIDLHVLTGEGHTPNKTTTIKTTHCDNALIKWYCNQYRPTFLHWGLLLLLLLLLSHFTHLTLCDPINGSPPGSPVPGILQARTLEWVAISFSNAWKWKWKWSRSCLTLIDPMDCSLLGSSVHGGLLASLKNNSGGKAAGCIKKIFL